MSDIPSGPPPPPEPSPRPAPRPTPRAPFGALLVVGIVAALVGGALGGALGASVAVRDAAQPGIAAGPLSRLTVGRAPAPVSGGRGVADVVSTVGPAVVTVVQRSANRQQTGGTGSGFVIDAERGYVATNSHVVTLRGGQPAPALDVILSDGRTVEARLVGRDPETDVAVLQIDPRGLDLRAAVLGNSDEVPVGASVIAIGSALGELTNTVTSGILSGKGRRLESDAARGIFLEDLVQTDASISPGNSGGPLIWADTNQVIGMNTLVLRSPAAEGLGFAVSSNTVRQIAEELIRNGRIERGRIGIRQQQVTPRIAMEVGLSPTTTGALVVEVLPGTPAAQAGLRERDVIARVNDATLDAQRPLGTVMLRFRPGDRIRLTVLRDGREQVVEVTLGR